MTQRNGPSSNLIVAGRRIDALNADVPRFPLACFDDVRQRLRGVYASQAVGTVIGSAACGGDLAALSAARDLSIRRRIVLPFSVQRFYESSVADRPGDWKEMYFSLTAEAASVGDLVILADAPIQPYKAATRRIIDEGLSLKRSSDAGAELFALAIWEGSSRGEGDATAFFLERATGVGISVLPHIDTMCSSSGSRLAGRVPRP